MREYEQLGKPTLTPSRVVAAPDPPHRRCASGTPRGTALSVGSAGVKGRTGVDRARALSYLWGRVTGVCARAPSLISVLEPGQGLGDMIVDGVSRGDVVRPLSLSGPNNARGALRLRFGRSWPRLLIEVRAVRASIVGQAGASASSPSARSV